MDLQLTPVCRWCGGGPLKPVGSFEPANGISDFCGPSPFKLAACSDCGAWQVNPHPDREAAKRFFQSPDRWKSSRDPDGVLISPIDRAEKRQAEYLTYTRAMVPLLPQSGAIYDVGAGTGLLLSLLDVSNPLVAVEPNPLAARLAEERGLIVINQWAEELAPPKRPLAALILNQTIDHLSRPDIFLLRALNWLAPGGLLLLGNLINPSCLAARIYGPEFRLFHPFHQVYPTPAAVRRVLQPLGFDILDKWRPYFGTPYGSCSKFLAASSTLALKLLRIQPPGPSPAFIGNTVTYLARKTLLTKTVPIKRRTPSSLPC
ncbi:MAG: class I SAM-dependent methyltransferase [Deltaproteobacteria bacterium]|nr:class I SAM-dependent methyltransferase [Deltaproteobacteria bacterium]